MVPEPKEKHPLGYNVAWCQNQKFIVKWSCRFPYSKCTTNSKPLRYTVRHPLLHHAKCVSLETYQLFPEPDTSVSSCRQSKTSPSGPFIISLTTPSSMSMSTAWKEKKSVSYQFKLSTNCFEKGGKNKN
jgi:hypothetical protein